MKLIQTDKKWQIVTSVRDLVEFLLVSGDIDENEGVRNRADAMLAGSRMHRKLQKAAGPQYHAEVPLAFLIDYEDYTLGIEGRADGIIYESADIGEGAGGVTVDEIKGMYLDVNALAEPIPVHLAQAKCYAYIISEKYNLDIISVQMTYVNLDTEEVKRFVSTYSFAELSEWFSALLKQYKRWADYLYTHKKERLASITGLTFPYPYRKGQRELVADVYRVIMRHGILFVQAPTGTGKTLATIYPAIFATGGGVGDQIFYLTAKTSTASVARDAFCMLSDGGYLGKTVQITAKEKICPLAEVNCTPEHCPYASGHYDRIRDAMYTALFTEQMFDRKTLLACADRFMVCPYELSLELCSWVDHIICDYNYVFDPNASLKRFFVEGRSTDAILLVDESHNLVERAREMYSETLWKEDFLRMKKKLKPFGKQMERALSRCNQELLSYKRQCENVLVVSSIDSFLFALLSLSAALDEFLQKEIVIEDREEVLEFYFRVRNFISLSELMDEHFLSYCDFTENGEFAIHLFCVDPSLVLQNRLNQVQATVFFSATLLPMAYYKKLLCHTEEVYGVYKESMFDPRRRRIFLGDDVTSAYKKRSPQMYESYASYIRAITEARTGNYMIFFPSYAFLEHVADAFLQRDSGENIILIQQKTMDETQRAEFLSAFETEHDKSLLAFCVMGGVFSEGIDLTGEKLIGVIVVGAALPQVSIRQQMIADHFEANGQNGFDFAYLYPGMNKVIQSAGRLIRTKDDTGVIALLDKRFCESAYQKTFPREWADARRCTLADVQGQAEAFWEEISL